MITFRAVARALGGLTAAGVLAALSVAPAVADDGLPVLGQALTMGIEETGEPAVVSVHGVRRVEGATIVYWSIGAPAGTTSSGGSRLGTLRSSFYDIVGPPENDVAVLDLQGQRLYRPLDVAKPADYCACSPEKQRRGLARPMDGQAVVVWSSVSELPPDVDTVAVKIAEQTMLGVPVEDGPMLPLAADQEVPIIVGMGWPEIDPDILAKGTPQDPASLPLASRVSDLERTVTTSKGEVSLASDVLFAKNSATLTAKGKSTVAAAAAQIKDGNGGTALTVTGHADSDGNAAENLTLSRNRAEAVAKELTGALGGGYTIKATGQGETQPIASNTTAAGKAKNRRVSITYTEGQ